MESDKFLKYWRGATKEEAASITNAIDAILTGDPDDEETLDALRDVVRGIPVRELREAARAKGVRNYSRLTATELARAIRESDKLCR